MTKELEELEALKEHLKYEWLSDFGYTEYYDILKQALQRLEAIENSNPSEALECLDYIENKLKDLEYVVKRDDNEYLLSKYIPNETLTIIKQALIKAQEQEKFIDDELLFKDGSITCGFDYKGKQIVAMPSIEYSRLMEQEKVLEIIKKKRVDVYCLLQCKTVKEYNDECFCKDDLLTQEEFEILKRYLNEN